MKLDPVELRGVGIQITKLDGETKAAEREAGQGTLNFGAKKTDTATDSKDETVNSELPFPETMAHVVEAGSYPKPPVRVAPSTPPAIDPNTLRNDDVSDRPEPDAPISVSAISNQPVEDHITTVELAPAKAALPRITRSTSRTQVVEPVVEPGSPRIITSSDGIDPDFLAALPPELRLEVKRDFARTRATSEKPPQPALAPAREPRATTISPAKPKGMHAAAHITKQLRPKVKTQLKAAAIADLPLYGAWAKATDKEEQVDLTAEMDEKIRIYAVSELRELEIDPDVFLALPVDMHKEIVDEERRKHHQRKILHRPADRSRFRSRERDSTRTASLSPSRSSRAGSVPPKPQQRIAITRFSKPALLKATALPAVLETVSRWIESRGSAGPAARDAGKVKTYLFKCMAPEAGLGGIENAVEVLKWMRSVLLERWEEEGKEITEGGKEWWATWRSFKEEMDQISMRRFGSPIRL